MPRTAFLGTALLPLAAAHFNHYFFRPTAPDQGSYRVVSPPGLQCADGTPWKLIVHEPAAAVLQEDFVFVDFFGGGGCFDTKSCTHKAGQSVQYIDGMSDAMNTVLGWVDGSETCDKDGNAGLVASLGGYGMFTQCNTPLANRRGILLTYCSGDLFLSDATCDYDGATVRHHGARHALYALEQLAKEFGSGPKQHPLSKLVLTGGSAGGWAATLWSGKAATLFPEAEVKVLADSSLHVPFGSPLADAIAKGLDATSGRRGACKTAAGEIMVDVTDWYSARSLELGWGDVAEVPTLDFAPWMARVSALFKVEFAVIQADMDGSVGNFHSYLEELYGVTQDRVEHMWRFLDEARAHGASLRSYVFLGGQHHVTGGPISALAIEASTGGFNPAALFGGSGAGGKLADVLAASDLETGQVHPVPWLTAFVLGEGLQSFHCNHLGYGACLGDRNSCATKDNGVCEDATGDALPLCPGTDCADCGTCGDHAGTCTDWPGWDCDAACDGEGLAQDWWGADAKLACCATGGACDGSGGNHVEAQAQALGCFDVDGVWDDALGRPRRVLDSYGDACSEYVGNENWCGGYDTHEFRSMDMCCACGGGRASGCATDWDCPVGSVCDAGACRSDALVFHLDAQSHAFRAQQREEFSLKLLAAPVVQHGGEAAWDLASYELDVLMRGPLEISHAEWTIGQEYTMCHLVDWAAGSGWRGLLRSDQDFAVMVKDGVLGMVSNRAAFGRTTKDGSDCKQNWVFAGYEHAPCTSSCCNPDEDAGGEWCFTDEFHGHWGYCAPAPERVTTGNVPCLTEWTYDLHEDAPCTSSCCNPDSDPYGEWCFTDERTGDWGYCAPAGSPPKEHVGFFEARSDAGANFRVDPGSWSVVCVVGEGESAAGTRGTSSFYVATGDRALERVGTAGRVVSGTTSRGLLGADVKTPRFLGLLGADEGRWETEEGSWPGEWEPARPGHLAKMKAWDRRLSFEELREVTAGLCPTCALPDAPDFVDFLGQSCDAWRRSGKPCSYAAVDQGPTRSGSRYPRAVLLDDYEDVLRTACPATCAAAGRRLAESRDLHDAEPAFFV